MGTFESGNSKEAVSGWCGVDIEPISTKAPRRIDAASYVHIATSDSDPGSHGTIKNNQREP